ncbi:MarR family winged helix-turn-helix transcriptional regulator [Paenibacillus sp. J22TS3]|uniref:MarR family winged helix-turn-helix transcriptional regulator n=1 Tax=Paenibacillus sp. J22TS3 TaxID=2807192 RepID=UPI001B2D5694|nr:MarR family transcriptional regulator [Paenibacillus sp. J22TS3]GIP23116.1 MarR family transcriptional regulator [Paenibacillus sp. J22TS3]
MTDFEASSANGELSAHDLIHLLLKTTHYLQQQFEKGLLAYGMPDELTGPRLRVLMEISSAGSIRMNELAKKLGIKARTVTQFIDALEKEHFIVRNPDPSDRRATILQLTDHAKPHIEKAEEVMVEVSENLLEHLSKEQQNQLRDILLHLGSSELHSIDSTK